MEKKTSNLSNILQEIDNLKDNINNNNDYYNYKKINSFLEQLDYYKKSFEDLLNNNNMVLDIQEKERQRIARDLHDSSLQNLAHLIHKLELAIKYFDVDIIQAKLEIALIKKNLKEIIDDIRNTIFNLRPMSFDDLGFKQSIERLIDNLKKIFNGEIELYVEEINSSNTLMLITVYRIINECLSNAVYHSKGKKIILNVIEKKSQLSIKIIDDGNGFDYEKMKNKKDVHFGLKIMEERILLLNGTLNVESNHLGTNISIEIPRL